jgi:hypothetical protein
VSAGGVGFAELLAVDEIRNLIVFAVRRGPARSCGGTGPRHWPAVLEYCHSRG